MSNLADQPQTSTRFDYEVLEYKNRIAVQQRTGEIKERLQRVAQDIWEIGQKLTEVRSWLKHGQFEVWLKTEFGWSHRTAYNFISVYEAFPEPANFAEIEIATSALYLLAAPSTPQELRSKFLQKAKAGEKVTHKQVLAAIRETKRHSISTTSTESLKPPKPEFEIVTILPKDKDDAENRITTTRDPESVTSSTTFGDSTQLGWYLVEGQHLLFCGDTASPQFFMHIPRAAFALAITSTDWDHDWLVDKARSVLILEEPIIEENQIKNLLTMFSTVGEAVIFPWLPNEKILVVAHKLGRQIFAGDPNPEQCIEVILKSGLRAEKHKP